MTLQVEALELWAPDAGYAFEIKQGGPDDLPVYRGENVTHPTKPGQTWMPKVTDHRLVTLHGQVAGEAGMLVTAPESYLDRITALNTIIDPANGLFSITLAAPFEGLASGETATLEVEFLRWVILNEGAFYRYGDIECICLDDPPSWVVDTGS